MMMLNITGSAARAHPPLSPTSRLARRACLPWRPATEAWEAAGMVAVLLGFSNPGEFRRSKEGAKGKEGGVGREDDYAAVASGRPVISFVAPVVYNERRG